MLKKRQLEKGIRKLNKIMTDLKTSILSWLTNNKKKLFLNVLNIENLGALAGAEF
jgi:hypothetical protein